MFLGENLRLKEREQESKKERKGRKFLPIIHNILTSNYGLLTKGIRIWLEFNNNDEEIKRKKETEKRRKTQKKFIFLNNYDENRHDSMYVKQENFCLSARDKNTIHYIYCRSTILLALQLPYMNN